MEVMFTAQQIRAIYPKLNQYFEFEYADIWVELTNSMPSDFEAHKKYHETSNIDHLPENHQVFFLYNKDISNFIEKYEFCRVDSYAISLTTMLVFMLRNLRNGLYGILEGNEMETWIYPDKKRLYEFLLDNFKKYNFCNLPKAQITISYGLDSQITVANHENWLYYFTIVR